MSWENLASDIAELFHPLTAPWRAEEVLYQRHLQRNAAKAERLREALPPAKRARHAAERERKKRIGAELKAMRGTAAYQRIHNRRG